MLNVQRFLRNKGTLQDLQTRYSIVHRVHKEYPDLVLLKYEQTESPMGERIVQECRGIILDRSKDWTVVSRSFDKFFNVGEGHAAQIDWSSARVQEKLDGSLCVVYNYQRKWHVATSGSPDASGQVGTHQFTFAELFWKVFRDKGYTLTDEDDPEICFMFELTTPFNRIVVAQQSSDLRLIGVRSKTSGIESHPSRFQHRFSVVQEFPLTDLQSIVDSFSGIDPINREGYVVVDGTFNRIKVKHPGYVALHHLKEGFSKGRLVEVVRSGESSEFLAYFPEWKEDYQEVVDKYEALVLHLEEAWHKLKDVEVQKDFALEAVKTRHSGALFALRAKKTPSIRQYLREVSITNLVKVLDVTGHTLPAQN